MLVYSVTITLPTPTHRIEFVAWLAEEHMADVVAAGAMDAEALLHDDPCVVQVLYHFASRDAFAQYERNEAPRLRAHVLTKFADAAQFAFARSTCEVAHRVR